MSHYMDEYRAAWNNLMEVAYGEAIARAQRVEEALREAHPDWFEGTDELPSSGTETEEFSRVNTALNQDYTEAFDDGVQAATEILDERWGTVADPIFEIGRQAKEIRVVDPDTGGMKGSKLAKFSMLPPDVMNELAEHYGKGEEKYPSDPETGEPNWQKGYSWRLSVDALERHLNAWKRGEDFDPETGSSHLIAVMWHASALRWFQIHGRGKDYRDVANGRAA